MGIDFHNLNFLGHAQDLGVRFERTLTIGRQALHAEPRQVEDYRRRRGLAALAISPPAAGRAPYVEPLLQQWFGAREVDSIDASDYEAATLIHDMNRPWPADAPGRDPYDAVLDFGCLEHVFDFPTAWRNCVQLCRPGGHLLHALPCNNLVGHGFYQFSPELFFNLYQPARGFELRALLLALRGEDRYWWAVADPMQLGRRVTLQHGHEAYLLVLARKRDDAPVELVEPPQQSDYAQSTWLDGPPPAAARHPAAALLQSLGLLDSARRWRARAQALRGAALALPAPDFKRLEIARTLRTRAVS